MIDKNTRNLKFLHWRDKKMSIGRNRFEYGHIIDQNTLEQTADEIKREVCERIDFKNGIIREINEV